MRNYLGLKSQLILVTITTIIISLVSLIVILPNFLIPFYEQNIYEVLKQPLPFIDNENKNENKDIAFIIEQDDQLILSNNLSRITHGDDLDDLTEKMVDSYGKIKLEEHTYYYQTSEVEDTKVTTFTDDSYIIRQRDSLNAAILPVVIFTLVITLSILLLYSNFLLRKIFRIKNKIDNFDNNNFNHAGIFLLDDELKILLDATEKARQDLISREKYKNNLFQNISHDLKTPIMVISSHVEAATDKAITNKKALEVISAEVNKLNKQVALILALNKANFNKNNNDNLETVDVLPVIKELMDKFKVVRPDLKWSLPNNKNYLMNGNADLWSVVLDNILNNFLRYAKKQITVRVSKDQLELCNDGENIDPAIIDKIFEPYKKGNNGKSGLGLAIVKETLDSLNYRICAVNEKRGVKFIISCK